MALTDPVEWDRLEAADVRPEPRCRAVFDRHRHDLPADYHGAVDYLHEVVRDDLDPDERPPEQGGIFVFAYLVESEGVADPADGEPAVTDASVTERRPDAETLERLFWEEELMPWWLAVRFGVHYTLVIYWFWEDGIPLMRWNLSPERREELDATERDGAE